MNNTELLQIRVSPKVRSSAEKVAIDSGFSSLQDALRLFLITYSRGDLQPTFTSKEDSSGGEVFDETFDEILNGALEEVKQGKTIPSAVVKKQLGIK